jgi:hypothetical protein
MTLTDLAGFFSDPQALEDMKRRAAGMAQSGARGFTTGLLGAPVDLANMAMGGAGGERPVMGSEWIGDKLSGMGLLSGKPQDAGTSLAELGGGLLNPGGALKAAAVKGPALAAMLFHASPYKLDKFDAAKIGKGEGAQAYGYGHYLAESPAVSGKGGAYYEQFKEHPAVAKTGGPFAHKVDLPDAVIEKMMDWDKPLSQQPEVLAKVKKLVGDNEELLEELPKYTGQDVHKYILPSIGIGRGGADDLKAHWLAKVGIPGIRYLDQGSRPLNKAAEGRTSNFVVFPNHEKELKILAAE